MRGLVRLRRREASRRTLRSGGVPRSRVPSRQIDRSFPRHRHKTSHTCDSICQSLSAIFHRRPHQGWNRRHRAPRLDEVAARRRRKEPHISSDRPYPGHAFSGSGSPEVGSYDDGTCIPVFFFFLH
jgi:hypothetical protein